MKQLPLLLVTLLFSFKSFTQDSSKTQYFLRFSNFKPDFGFSSNRSFDIPGQLNILDADPTNHPGHSLEFGLKWKILCTTFFSTSVGIANARQSKSFLNYRSVEDYLEFGYNTFYITSASYEHRRLFLNTSVEQYLFFGLFVEAGMKVTGDISSNKQNVPSFNNPAIRKTYASVFYDIPKQSTPFILFYNFRIGYNYKGFTASFLYEQNFTKMERTFTLRGVEYTERQPHWKNIGFSLSYTFNKNDLKNQASMKNKK
jgi:hypothetical protein